MFLIKMIIRNVFRHRLRAFLTIIGVAVAIMAFGMLRTLVDLWYLGAERSSASRLITRNAVSLVFPLPLSYKDRIRQINGVGNVTYGNWFGGIYIDEKHFFANEAIGPPAFLDLYPEFVLPPDQKLAFIGDRKACIVGQKLADRYGWQIGDQIVLRGTIFPGQWEFVLRGIFKGADRGTEERVLLFHWDYLNETLKKRSPRQADQVGFYVVGLNSPEQAAIVAEEIDRTFRNSLAETLTETEKAFHLGFVAMTEAIMVAIQVVSYVVILIIMAVATNTMAMAARERISEYAVMKTIGLGAWHIALLVTGESMLLALLGWVVGVLGIFPASRWIETELAQYFPYFSVSLSTVFYSLAAAFVIGATAAVFPVWRGINIQIADGLRRIG